MVLKTVYVQTEHFSLNLGLVFFNYIFNNLLVIHVKEYELNGFTKFFLNIIKFLFLDV